MLLLIWWVAARLLLDVIEHVAASLMFIGSIEENYKLTGSCFLGGCKDW